MRCGHEGSASSGECRTKMYADKRTQKCYRNKKEKEKGGDIRTD